MNHTWLSRTQASLPLVALLLSAVPLGRLRAADASPFGPVTFDGGKGVLELNERLRFENRSNNFDFNSDLHSPTDGAWFLQRLRVGGTWKPEPGWSVQLQLQDSREWGSERPKVPFILGAEGNDALDLRIASVTWADPKSSPFSLTVGRQILSVGEERLVGSSDWNNFARTFDAVKGGWSMVPGQTTLTAFFGGVVHVESTHGGQGWKFDRSTRDDLFSGVVLTQKLDPRQTVETYFLWREKKDNTPIYSAPTANIPAAARTASAYDIGQRVGTGGVRFARLPKAGDWDAEFEGALQGGKVDRQTTAAAGPYAGTAPELDQRAWALHSLLGYSLAGVPGKIRLSAEYNAASGDTNRNDGKNGSFMNLFPSNHKFYGFMDVFSWKNLREEVVTLRSTPRPDLLLRVDLHRFALASSQDAWYRANGVATVRPLNAAAQNAPRRAGEELDVTATWTPRSWAALDVGWARFFSGPYLKATGAASDANFVYAQTTLKF